MKERGYWRKREGKRKENEKDRILGGVGPH
jgi:hypothetical protein